MNTPENVKLLLSPRQNRRITHFIYGKTCMARVSTPHCVSMLKSTSTITHDNKGPDPIGSASRTNDLSFRGGLRASAEKTRLNWHLR